MARTSQLTKIFFPKTNKSLLRPKVGILLALQEAFHFSLNIFESL